MTLFRPLNDNDACSLGQLLVRLEDTWSGSRNGVRISRDSTAQWFEL